MQFESTQPYNEIDDYIATFSDEERQEYVAAEMALDLASTLYHLRQAQGLTQREAAVCPSTEKTTDVGQHSRDRTHRSCCHSGQAHRTIPRCRRQF